MCRTLAARGCLRDGWIHVRYEARTLTQTTRGMEKRVKEDTGTSAAAM
jgi:hypothetical protein